VAICRQRACITGTSNANTAILDQYLAVGSVTGVVRSTIHGRRCISRSHLSYIHTGDEVEFNTVMLWPRTHWRQSRPSWRHCRPRQDVEFKLLLICRQKNRQQSRPYRRQSTDVDLLSVSATVDFVAMQCVPGCSVPVYVTVQRPPRISASCLLQLLQHGRL